jgi:hypothetical protein
MLNVNHQVFKIGRPPRLFLQLLESFALDCEDCRGAASYELR